ncbi:MAG: GAF domain-containing protein, partial [Cyanobacteria bacterium J06639_1]
MTQPSPTPMLDEPSRNGSSSTPKASDFSRSLSATDESDPLAAFRADAPSPSRKRLSWRQRAMMTAFAAGALPVLVVGTAVYGLGSRLLPALETAERETPAVQTLLARTLNRQRSGLAWLSVGTGAWAIAAGAAAAAIARTQLDPVARVAKTTRGTAKRLNLEGDADSIGDEVQQMQADADSIANRLPELLWQQETRAEQSAAIAAIEHRLRHATSTADILNITVKTVRNLLEADRTSVFCFDETGEGTFVAESVASGYPKALRATVHDPCFNEGYADRYRRGRILAIHNIYNAGLTDCHIGLLERFAVKANLVGPLMQGDRLYGLLIVHQCDNPRHWDATEIDLLGQISARVGLALSFAEHLHAAERQSERAASIADLPKQLHGLRDETAIFTRATQAFQQAIAAEHVAAIAFDAAGESRIVSVDGNSAASASQLPSPAASLSESDLDTLRAGHPIARSRPLAELIAEQTLDAASLFVPVLGQNTLFGVLHARHQRTDREWSAIDLDMASCLAAQTGCALDVARVLRSREEALSASTALAEQERARAERLQQQWSGLFGDGDMPAIADLQARSQR